MTSLLPLLLLTIPTAEPPAPPAPEDPPAAVVVVRSVDELAASATYLGGPLDSKEEVGKFKLLIDTLVGLDRTRPAGLAVRWPADKVSPDAEDLVGFAAVKDEKLLLAACALHGTVAPVGPLHQLTLRDGTRLFLRMERGRIYAAARPEALRSLPAEDVLSFPRDEEGTLLARAWPAKARGLPALVKPLVQQWADLTRQVPGLDPGSHAQMKTGIEGAARGLLPLINEIQELNLRIRIDRDKDDLDLQFAVLPTPGMDRGFLSGACRYFGQARGRFTPLLADTAFAVQVVFPVAGPSGNETALPPIPPGLLDFIPPRYQDVGSKAFQAIFATLSQDGLNAAYLRYPDSTGLLAVKARQGRKLDVLVRDLYRGASAAERKAVHLRLNQDRVGGARIHHLQLKGQPLHLALRDDLLVAGAVESTGKQHWQALLKASLAPEEPAGPFLRIESRGPWFKTDADFWKKFRTEAPRTEPAALHARLHLEGGSCLRLKVRLHTHMLTALRLALGD
jgi:hypothetical protein